MVEFIHLRQVLDHQALRMDRLIARHMLGFIIKKIIGSKNDREIKRLRPMITKINELETSLQSKPDEYLRERTTEWKAKLSAIENNDCKGVPAPERWIPPWL